MMFVIYLDMYNLLKLNGFRLIKNYLKLTLMLMFINYVKRYGTVVDL